MSEPQRVAAHACPAKLFIETQRLAMLQLIKMRVTMQ